jgi:hypothetical protein
MIIILLRAKNLTKKRFFYSIKVSRGITATIQDA